MRTSQATGTSLSASYRFSDGLEHFPDGNIGRLKFGFNVKNEVPALCRVWPSIFRISSTYRFFSSGRRLKCSRVRISARESSRYTK